MEGWILFKDEKPPPQKEVLLWVNEEFQLAYYNDTFDDLYNDTFCLMIRGSDGYHIHADKNDYWKKIQPPFHESF